MNKIDILLQTAGIKINGSNPWDPQIPEREREYFLGF
jgi:hypothetical protein